MSSEVRISRNEPSFVGVLAAVCITLAASTPLFLLAFEGWADIHQSLAYAGEINFTTSISAAGITAAAISVSALWIASGVRWTHRPIPTWAFVALFVPATVPPLLLGFGYAVLAYSAGFPQGAVLLSAAEYCAFFPLGVAIILRRLSVLPDDLVNCATNLGASTTKTIFEVVAPYCRRDLVVVWCISFVLCFSDAVFSLFLAGPSPLFGQTLNNLSLSASNTTAFGIGAIYVAIIATIALVGVGAILFANSFYRREYKF